MNDADNASMRLYFTRGWAIECFFQNLLATPRSIISLEVRKQQQKNLFLLFSISKGQKTKMAEF